MRQISAPTHHRAPCHRRGLHFYQPWAFCVLLTSLSLSLALSPSFFQHLYFCFSVFFLPLSSYPISSLLPPVFLSILTRPLTLSPSRSPSLQSCCTCADCRSSLRRETLSIIFSTIFNYYYVFIYLLLFIIFFNGFYYFFIIYFSLNYKLFS